MMDELDTHHGLPREIRRDHLYDDVIATYRENPEVLCEFPFRVSYEKELAVDTGGVCRDMYSAFWNEAYLKHFDGESLLVPAVHPNTNLAVLPILGTIISHGFMVSGFLPIRVAFPVLAAVLCGTDVKLPDVILVESFVDYLSSYESSILREAVHFAQQQQQQQAFSKQMVTELISILSRLGCTEIPNPANIKLLIANIAKHQLIAKPLGALFTLRSGVPSIYHAFWNLFSVEKLFSLYKSLNASPASVLKMIEEPSDMNFAQDRVFHYLLTFIGNAKQEQLRLFLRFVTGSSVRIAKPIVVTFNNLTDLARRPISHTCDCTLEVPIAYTTYPEFELEFSLVLNHEMSWIMDTM